MGPALFQSSYDRALVEWKAIQRTHSKDQHLLLRYHTPNSRTHLFDVASLALADDISHFSVASTVQELVNLNVSNTTVLRNTIGARGLRLNQKKGKVLLHFAGRNSYRALHNVLTGQLNFPEQVCHDIKYLGEMCNTQATAVKHLQDKEQAARVMFGLYSRFLTSNCSLIFRSLVLKSTVISSLLQYLFLSIKPRCS